MFHPNYSQADERFSVTQSSVSVQERADKPGWPTFSVLSVFPVFSVFSVFSVSVQETERADQLSMTVCVCVSVCVCVCGVR